MPRFSFVLTDRQMQWVRAQTHPFRSQADVMRSLIESAQLAQEAQQAAEGRELPQ